MSFTAILGCCSSVADSSSTWNVHSYVLQEGKSYASSAWCGFAGCARSSDLYPGTPLVHSWAVWELGLLPAEFCAAACFSPLCPQGRVLLWSQVSRPALPAHREPWKAETWWCPVAHMKHSNREVRGAGLGTTFHTGNGSLERALALTALTRCLVKAKFWSG